VRYFLRRDLPPGKRLLLVESGSRHLLEGIIEGVRNTWGHEVFVDLVTCYPGVPAGFEIGNTRVYRVTDYRTPEARRQLFAALRRNGYDILGIICSAEPIMTKWKWALAWKLPVKVFVLNENSDYFWVDRAHLRTIWNFALFRAGLAGAGAVRTLARLALFPFTLAYLLLYAAAVHLRRAMRRV
jgi:hypothetical protein